jgi:eukaryotic-like serine/threonine-protein kinase
VRNDDELDVTAPTQAADGDISSPTAGQTLATIASPNAPTVLRDSTLPNGASPLHLPDAGFELGAIIGRGGMGEVLSARDLRIGREVAIKRMRGTASHDSIQRFLREARIQARLEHPSVPPVHELDVDEAGRPYFAMKRLVGVTLAVRIASDAPLQRLLRAFCDVCLAIGFAHDRGVVHRDLKPANIMLGEYGEVYVLDWGIARVLEESTAHVESDDVSSLEGGTQVGDLIGTPGYMAPEQCRGEPAVPASDVYALGVILFEILTRTQLHAAGMAALASTLELPQVLPSSRAPSREIPPELDRVCWDALAELGSERPTARALGEAIERYLDGDRDLARRRQLAGEQLAIARAAYESADPERRAVAMQSAGRALALDPRSVEAAALVTTLLVEPPKQIPSELADQLQSTETRDLRDNVRKTVGALARLLGLCALVPMLAVRNWMTMALALGVPAVCSVTLWWTVSHQQRRLRPLEVCVMAGAFVLAISRVLGTFVLTPTVITGALFAMCANPWLRSRRYPVYIWLFVICALPMVLEASGIFLRTLDVADGHFLVTSPIFRTHGIVDELALALANLILLFSIASYAIATNRRIFEANKELRTQAWHLAQLIPTQSRDREGIQTTA